MTIEEHILGLTGIKIYMQKLMLKTNYECMGEADAREVGETIDAGIKALEKQIPRKPIIEGNGWYDAKVCFCPACYHLGGHDDWKNYVKYDQEYCDVCGQRLEWGEE